MKVGTYIGIPNRDNPTTEDVPQPNHSLYELEGSTFNYMLESGGFYETERNYFPTVNFRYLLEDNTGGYDLEAGGGYLIEKELN